MLTLLILSGGSDEADITSGGLRLARCELDKVDEFSSPDELSRGRAQGPPK